MSADQPDAGVDDLVKMAERLGTTDLQRWKEFGKLWRSRYDEMVETCRIAGEHRDAAIKRVEELEEALNRVFHTTDCTTGQMAIIDEVLSTNAKHIDRHE